MKPIALAFALLALLPLHDAAAQRRQGSALPAQVPQERPRPCDPSSLDTAPDPYGTLERELPSLKVDLALRPDQAATWSAFERGVRVVAELDRHRLRQMLPLRDRKREAPLATAVLGMLAELDRRKSEATHVLHRELVALYDGLDEKQQRMLDRRLALSQSDPLSLRPAARPD